MVFSVTISYWLGTPYYKYSLCDKLNIQDGKMTWSDQERRYIGCVRNVEMGSGRCRPFLMRCKYLTEERLGL